MTTSDSPLTPWQARAVDTLRRLRVGALYMESGTGKARTVAELARFRWESGKIAGAIWLCPCRERESLRRELRAVAPWAEGVVALGGIESLSHCLGLFAELMAAARARPCMLIVDGSTLVKNPGTLRFQRALALAEECPYRLIVSAAPFTRDIADLYAQWRLLDWRILGYRTYWSFASNHLDGNGRTRNVDYLARAMEPYLFQVLRADVMETPGKREYLWRFAPDEGALACYREVIERFLLSAQYSRTGVYRLLHAAQHAVCGRVVVRDYPMKTAPMYKSVWENPRIRALLDVLAHYRNERVLILYKYAHERQDIRLALGGDCADLAEKGAHRARRLTQNQLAAFDLNACGARVLVYYSQHWDWARRRDREEGRDDALTVINLVAADTIDERIVRCVWRKESLVEALREEIKASGALPTILNREYPREALRNRVPGAAKGGDGRK